MSSVQVDATTLDLVDSYLGSCMEQFLVHIQQHKAMHVRQRVEIESCGAALLSRDIATSATALVHDMVVSRDSMCSRQFDATDMQTSVLFNSMRQSSVADCHRVVDAIRRDAARMDPKPYEFQIRIIELMLQLSGPRIYGHFWHNGSLAIRKRNGWTVDNDGIAAVLTGRKEGKSTGIAMSILLLMMNIPSYKCAVMSLTREQSQIIRRMVGDLAALHPRAREEFVVVRNSAFEFGLAPQNNKLDQRCVHAYSGNPKVKCFFFVCMCVCVYARLTPTSNSYDVHFFIFSA